MKVTIRPLRTDDWGAIRGLFGERGACGGCWCMAWRRRKKDFDANLGASNRRAFQRLVRGGRAQGVLAFDGDEPVAWCSVGPRADFPRLLHARTLQTDWDEDTWSVSCFFLRRDQRGKGLSIRLLREALKVARSGGAKRVEGYPVRPYASGESMPGAFAWTGLPRIFEAAGFRDVTPKGQTRPIYLKRFRGG